MEVFNEKVTVDEMLQKHCGEFGRWQFRHLILTSLAWILEVFHTMVIIFADNHPPFRCKSTTDCDPRATSVCGFDPRSWEWYGGLEASTVSQWGLICHDKFKVGLVQSVFFGGCLIGAGIFGYLSDSTLGRRGSMKVVCFLNALFGCLTSFSPNYSVYLLLRLLTGFGTGGLGVIAYVLATEPIGPSKRGAIGMCSFYFFSIGIALLSAIAYLCQTWRHLYIFTSIPSFLFLIIVLPFIDESPRWYLVRGRINEAMNVMQNMAKTNGKSIPNGVIVAMDGTDTKEVKGCLTDIIRSPITRTRLLLVVAINFLCAMVYYGLSLNVVNLETSLYINVLVNGLIELPAIAITAVLLRYGRKPLTIGSLVFSGVFCIGGSLMGSSRLWKLMKTMSGAMGMFGMTGTYNLLFIYTAELFPTTVRNAALGFASQAAQMGAILAPFIVVLGRSLPLAVFGMAGMIAWIFACFLPETLNRPLYDTLTGIEDGERQLVSQCSSSKIEENQLQGQTS